jgi:hypothetical protein
MTPLQRSRRLQTGLAGLGIVGALGASFGIGQATHTGHGQVASTGTTTPGSHHRSGSTGSGSGSTGRTHEHQRARSTSTQPSSPPVSAPSPAAPLATTSGS